MFGASLGAQQVKRKQLLFFAVATILLTRGWRLRPPAPAPAQLAQEEAKTTSLASRNDDDSSTPPTPPTPPSQTIWRSSVNENDGAYHLKNVCLGRKPSDDKFHKPNLLFFYGDIDPSLVHRDELKSTAQVAFINDTATHMELSLDGSLNHSSVLFVVPEETLMIYDLYAGNPAHCLGDHVFSIAMDLYQRNKTTNRHQQQQQGLYETNVVAQGHKFAYCPDGHWCCEILHRSGLVHLNRTIFHPEINKSGGKKVCFQNLIVPKFKTWRFPIDWSKPEPAGNKQLISMVQERNQSYVRLGVEPWNDDGDQMNILFKPGMYPLRALQWIQTRISNAFGFNMSRHTKPKHLTAPILMFDRKGIRRSISNSGELKTKIETHFGVSVDLVDETAWVSFSLQEQATLFNKHQIIISPHAAHMANIIVARPGTFVLEFSPHGGYFDHPNTGGNTGIDLNLTVKQDEDSWYGSHTWTSVFSRRLGVEHFNINPMTNIGHNVDNFKVPYDLLEKLLLSRVGLKKLQNISERAVSDDGAIS